MSQLMNRFEKEEILLLLKKLISEKLSGTTVIPVDEAENLLSSILYTLDFAVNDNSNNKVSVNERFELGKRRISEKVEAVKIVYEQVCATHSQLPVDSYQNLLKEFKQFFESYDVDYAADQTGTLWIDYLPAFPVDDQSLKGIDFVAAYLQQLLWENQFCRRLPDKWLSDFFEEYGQQGQLNYRVDINNIYERVFFQMTGKYVAAEKFPDSLFLTELEFETLSGKMKALSKNQLTAIFNKFIEQLKLPILGYYKKSFELFLSKMTDKESVERRRSLFIFERKPVALFIANEGLLLSDFTLTIQQLEALQGIEKIDLLMEKFLSVYDYLDLFELDLLNDKEFELLFKQLGTEMTAIFIKLVLSEERETAVPIDAFLAIMFESNWKKQLQKYLAKLTKKQQEELSQRLLQINLHLPDFR